MADYTQNPTALDVENLLKSTSYWPVGDDESAQVLLAREQAQIAVDGAVSEFEERTGWRPFLADETYVQYFDNTDYGGYLDFGGGAIEVTGVSIAGTAQTLDDQWWLQPSNAARRNRPYTGIRLNRLVTAYKPNQIAVTAKWGYSAAWPAAAWLACMRLAAAQTLGQIPNAQGIASISQDSFSKSYDVVGIVTSKDLLVELTKKFEAIVKVYTRQVC